MKIRFGAFAASILPMAIACRNEAATPPPEATPSGNVTAFAASAQRATDAPPPAPDDSARFAAFWANFRSAVAAGDPEHVAALTEFPFKIRGPSDSDPVVSHRRDKFDLVYAKVMGQPVFKPVSTGFSQSSMRDLVSRQEAPPVTDDQTHAAFEMLRFERRDGNWRLVMAYLEE